MIANALARQGRHGGWVTSYQDADLTGFGSTRAPEHPGTVSGSLLRLLDEVAPLPPDLRRWVADSLSQQLPSGRSVLAALQREVPEQGFPLERFAALAAAHRAGWGSPQSLCRSANVAPGLGVPPWDAMLRDEFIRASARGAAIDALTAWAGQLPEVAPRPTREAWAAANLDGSPSPMLAGSESLLDAVRYLRELMADATDQAPLTGLPFTLPTHADSCRGNALARHF